MRDFLELIKEFWLFFVGAVGALLTILKGYHSYKSSQKESMKMLYKEFEHLKQNWITTHKKEIMYIEQIQDMKESHMKEKAMYSEKILFLNSRLDALEKECPACYLRVVKNSDTP